MKTLFTVRFHRSFVDAPEDIKRAFDKQLSNLLRDLRHPSIRAKKYDATRWQGRVTRGGAFISASKEIPTYFSTSSRTRNELSPEKETDIRRGLRV
jgi:hypothetical protein